MFGESLKTLAVGAAAIAFIASAVVVFKSRNPSTKHPAQAVDPKLTFASYMAKFCEGKEGCLPGTYSSIKNMSADEIKSYPNLSIWLKPGICASVPFREIALSLLCEELKRRSDLADEAKFCGLTFNKALPFIRKGMGQCDPTSLTKMETHDSQNAIFRYLFVNKEKASVFDYASFHDMGKIFATWARLKFLTKTGCTIADAERAKKAFDEQKIKERCLFQEGN